MSGSINDKIKNRYNRVSHVYDSMDKMMKEDWRKDLLKNVKGDVLEVGIGTGANLPYYPEGIHLTGIDFSPGMLEKARKKLADHPGPYDIDLYEMDIQALAFPDDSFDYVIATCVFCSVPDPVKGLRELGRVCKPDGEILMLEHMRSDNELVGKAMELINPVPVNIWGANIDRRTLDNINKAGLTIVEDEKLFTSIVRKLKVKPNH